MLSALTIASEPTCMDGRPDIRDGQSEKGEGGNVLYMSLRKTY